jgi:DNA-binding PadR family transcriptional regulator
MHRHQHGYRHEHQGDDRRHMRGGFGFGGQHRHRGLHGGRTRRVFDQGDLRYVLLQLIADKPSHGYELIKAIEEKFGGTYSPSPGIIYPTLTLLEELGYARIAAETGGRKLYSITDEGTAFLAANRPAVDTVMARMAEISQAYGGGPAPEIQRAMRNLETALMIRLGRGPLGVEQVRAVTAILDRVAGEIEQS